ncbi:hypothetical protein B0T24DRAFT_70351 [Lasiosphaeria ovina]|uniref:AMP-activated protein kinase glycogen-binding domain-containing protein n=1 Tax=Lasiosphaeria ovina TaxID=92902 RepID=A0AAE0NLW7_9PEZI|nr:hypothetical protein B0T24DRAFT_70351 [Lasiosphaeria ovina]
MGTFVFKWPHPAEEVYVTGTFDGWSKSEQLAKVGDGFEKKVTLPDSSQKIYYKFVVDHEWITDHEAPREKDHEGNENNFLLPSQIMATKQEAGPGAAAISSAAPESTTAQLAGAVPLEEAKDNLTAPGGYPETPAADANKEFKVSPLPATEGALNPIKLEPGQKVPEGLTAGNINSNVTLDKESYENSGAEKEFKVSPLPATEGALNPIKLEPGQKIPEGITAGNINSNVTLDKESYEKSDRIPGLDTELPPISNTMIPESSLPILGGDVVAFSSAAPNSTTAALAGAVPLEEPKVPEIVKESQEKAQVDPEASGISEEVKEKAAVEDELLQKVSEAPSTSEGTSGKGTEKSETDKTIAETVAAAAATARAAVLGAALVAKQTATDTATDVAASLPGLQESVKQALPVSIQDAIGATKKETAPETISSEVPTEVKESIEKSGESPEAATNTAAVEEKKEVEAELLKQVNATDSGSKPVSPEVPAEVKESIEKSGESPEAAASTAAVEEKKEVEAELLKQVEVTPATSESSTQLAEVKLVDTKPETSKTDELKPEDAKPVEIQPAEVKPEAPKEEPVQVGIVKPTTNGAGTTTTETSETTPQPAVSAPAEGVAASSSKPADVAASSEKKKKNRLSAIISKLRHKVSSKDKA